MKILSFEFSDPYGIECTIPHIDLNRALNLFVGASGSGKTRLLNVLFNIGSFAASDRFAEHSTGSADHRCRATPIFK